MSSAMFELRALALSLDPATAASVVQWQDSTARLQLSRSSRELQPSSSHQPDKGPDERRLVMQAPSLAALGTQHMPLKQAMHVMQVFMEVCSIHAASLALSFSAYCSPEAETATRARHGCVLSAYAFISPEKLNCCIGSVGSQGCSDMASRVLCRHLPRHDSYTHT